jgi:ABC-2 type transport system permease protein
MRPFFILLKRELAAYLLSPLGYALWLFFSLFNGYFLTTLVYYLQSTVAVGFWISNAAMISLFVVPFITMRLFADDYQHNSFDFFLQLPIKPSTLFIAKTAASFLIYTGLIALNIPAIALIGWWGHADILPLLAYILGLLGFGYALLSIGILAGALTSHALTAALLSVGFNLVLWLANGIKPLSFLSLYAHISAFSTAVIPLYSIIFIMGFMGISLSAAYFIWTKKTKQPVGRKTAIGFSLVFASIFLAGIISAYSSFSVDMSGQSLKTLSSHSKKIVTQINSPLTLTLIPDNTPESLRYLTTLIKTYTKQSPLIHMAVENPTENGQIRVSYQGKTLAIPLTRFFLLLDNPPQQLFLGESILTGAIKRLTQGSPIVFFTLGHGEKSLINTDSAGLSWLARSLEDDGYTVLQAPLATCPPSAAVVILAGASEVFSAGDTAILNRLSHEKTSVIVLTDPFRPQPLALWLSQHGVYLSDKAVIDQDSASFYHQNEIVAPSYWQQATSDNKPVVLAGVSPITAPREATMLLRSTSTSWTVQTPGAIPGPNDTEGPFDLGISIGTGSQKLAVIGDSDFLSNIAFFTGGNRNFALNLIAYAAGQEQSSYPRIKALEKLSLTSFQLGILALVALAIMPGMGLIVGVIVWMKRRR